MFDPFSDIRFVDACGRRWLDFNWPVKRCARCRWWRKTPAEFAKQRFTADRLHPWCRSCMADYGARWRAANLDYKARYRAANPEAHRAHNRRWSAAHPEHEKATRHRRRARVLGAPGSHTVADLKKLKARQKRCCYCGGPFTKDSQATLDHVIALAAGGSNELSNLTLAHGPCNSAKGVRRFNPITQQGILL
jgi:5-methylcytosine-specific restriction endonuclease McrA